MEKATKIISYEMALLCHHQFRNESSSQFIFLDIDQETGAPGIINHSISFSTGSHAQIICCHHTWLLLSTFTKKTSRQHLTYHVVNPLTKRCFTLPPPLIDGKVIASGLAFDNTHHFHVVLAHADDGTGYLELDIFSSGTGKWRKHLSPIKMSKPQQVPKTTYRVYTWLNQILGIKKYNKCSRKEVSSVFSNGAIHWVINGQLLVYRLEDDECEQIELPNSESSKTYQHGLWESGGRVQYSYADDKGFHSWDLLRKEDHDLYLNYNIYDKEKFRWRLVQSIYQKKLGFKKWNPYLASPVAYNEAIQTMYLQLPKEVISYNTRTEVIERVCTLKAGGRNTVFPFFYPGICNQKLSTRRPGPSEAVPVNLQEVQLQCTTLF